MKMKGYKLMVISAITVIGIFNGCSPADYRDIGAPRNVMESLSGTWKLTKAVQTDEDAAQKGFPYQQIDITDIFPYTDFVLTLNADVNGPTTFTTTPGASPKIIQLSSGNWTVDDVQYPKEITLTSGGIVEKATLGSYPVGASKMLALKVERRDASSGKLLISYNYQFTKQ